MQEELNIIAAVNYIASTIQDLTSRIELLSDSVDTIARRLDCATLAEKQHRDTVEVLITEFQNQRQPQRTKEVKTVKS